jgi:DNA invertase Pin-like site-specific DNA recombinase
VTPGAAIQAGLAAGRARDIRLVQIEEGRRIARRAAVTVGRLLDDGWSLNEIAYRAPAEETLIGLTIIRPASFLDAVRLPGSTIGP